MYPFNSLSHDDIEALLGAGEFSEKIRRAAPQVVVVMTQDWCPQWHDMAAYLPAFADRVAIFATAYNRLPDFERIMAFKEEVFGNDQVPYVRYYREGRLVAQTNWLSRDDFAAMLARP